MILFLRALFVVVLASMVAVTSWASLYTSVLAIPDEVLRHPWFIATLADAYWAFVAVYVWIAWKERSVAARVLWLIALLALGNISIAVYFLRELWREGTTSVDALFTRRNDGDVALPAILTAVSAAVYLLASRT